MLVSFLNTFF